jgi:hypothetical protein
MLSSFSEETIYTMARHPGMLSMQSPRPGVASRSNNRILSAIFIDYDRFTVKLILRLEKYDISKPCYILTPVAALSFPDISPSFY